jgi:hypothetical protein
MARYGQETLQPGVFQATTEKSLEPTGNTPQENLWTLSTKMGSQLAEGAIKQYGVVFGISMPPLAKQAELLSRLPIARTPSPNGVQAITRELVNHLAQQMHLNFQAMNALTASRSPLDLLRAQTDLAKGTSKDRQREPISTKRPIRNRLLSRGRTRRYRRANPGYI